MALMDVVNQTVWQVLKSYLPPDTRLTSVYRPPQAQLDFIVQKAGKHGYSFSRKPTLNDKTSWQGALKFVRARGYQVAAPGSSMHQKAIAYDLVGPSLDKIAAAMRKAAHEGAITLVHESSQPIRIEPPPQNVVHVEIEAVTLFHDPFDWA